MCACACVCVRVRACVCMSNSQQKSAKLQSTADAIHGRTACRPDAIHSRALCRPDAIHSRTACRPALTARFHAHAVAAATARMHSYATATDHTRASALKPATYGGWHWPRHWPGPALARHWPGTGPALARHWPGTGPALARQSRGSHAAATRHKTRQQWRTNGAAAEARPGPLCLRSHCQGSACGPLAGAPAVGPRLGSPAFSKLATTAERSDSNAKTNACWTCGSARPLCGGGNNVHRSDVPRRGTAAHAADPTCRRQAACLPRGATARNAATRPGQCRAGPVPSK